jgi:hypothetical protein
MRYKSEWKSKLIIMMLKENMKNKDKKKGREQK